MIVTLTNITSEATSRIRPKGSLSNKLPRTTPRTMLIWRIEDT